MRRAILASLVIIFFVLLVWTGNDLHKGKEVNKPVSRFQIYFFQRFDIFLLIFQTPSQSKAMKAVQHEFSVSRLSDYIYTEGKFVSAFII